METLCLGDMVDVLINKVAFINEVFCLSPPGRALELSYEALQGLLFILSDIRNDMEFIVNELGQIQKEVRA